MCVDVAPEHLPFTGPAEFSAHLPTRFGEIPSSDSSEDENEDPISGGFFPTFHGNPTPTHHTGGSWPGATALTNFSLPAPISHPAGLVCDAPWVPLELPYPVAGDHGGKPNHLSSINRNGTTTLLQDLAIDKSIFKATPKLSARGVHIFLDMSNIHISFLETAKEKLYLPKTARFSRNPRLDLYKLTGILTRERKVKTLRAGCSIMPNSPEPAFIEELHQLGYKTDVLERRPRAQPNHSREHDPYNPPSPTAVHYVEELVDETLQTRIGETFMDACGKRATLILATGDAKPAPHSAGFYKYVTNALRSGWNVEVVCWKCSCSSLWRQLAAKAENTHRFRLIELDDYLDILWNPLE